MTSLCTAWIIDGPNHPPMQRLVRIEVCPKTAWAITGYGQRYLIGHTAFFTFSAADLRWQGWMDFYRKSAYFRWKYPDRAARFDARCRYNVYAPHS